MAQTIAKARSHVFWLQGFLGATFLFYFVVLLYSECGAPDKSWAHLETKRLVQGLVLLIAVCLVSTHPFDRRAQLGALFLAVVGTAPAFPHEEMRAVWRSLPRVAGALLWIPQVAHLMAMPLLYSFYSLLPRALLHKTWQWILVWVPAVALSPWPLNGLYHRVYHPPYLRDLPRWYLFAAGLCILIYGFGGLAALFCNFRKLRSPSERRQMRVLTLGSIVGWAPGLLFLSAIFLAPFTESRLVWSLVEAPFKHIALALFLLVPASLLYAALRDRVLDLR
jgi:hypothetical protein